MAINHVEPGNIKKPIRHIKVMTKASDRKAKYIAEDGGLYYSGYQSVDKPWINIQAHWLAEAGFPCNTPVKVHVMEGCLVLLAQKPEAQVNEVFQQFEHLSEDNQAMVMKLIRQLASKTNLNNN